MVFHTPPPVPTILSNSSVTNIMDNMLDLTTGYENLTDVVSWRTLSEFQQRIILITVVLVIVLMTFLLTLGTIIWWGRRRGMEYHWRCVER